MNRFDLKRALAGEPVVTRDGREVTQLTQFTGVAGDDRGYPLYGVVNEGVACWKLTGDYCDSEESRFDLFMASVKHEGWMAVGINKNSDNTINTSDIYETQEEVKKHWCYVAPFKIIKVEWEE